MRNRKPTFKLAIGATLIELLITLVILSLGLLGVAGLQTNAIQGHHDAYMYSIAAFHANDITERMRANTFAVRQGRYARANMGGAVAAATDCRAASCTADQMAAYDLSQWISTRVSVDLPSGDATITSLNWDPSPGNDVAGNRILAPADVTIIIRWVGRVGGNCDVNGGNAGSNYKCFTFTAKI